MALTNGTCGIPPMFLLILSAATIFVGLFAFIFSCILTSPVPIMLGMVLTGLGIILLLTGLKVLKFLETNNLVVASIIQFSAVINFMEFVNYCRVASINSNYNPYLAASIVLVLLLIGLLIFSISFAILLFLNCKQSNMTCNSTATTVTTTRTATTTIETPPATYGNEGNSQAPK